MAHAGAPDTSDVNDSLNIASKETTERSRRKLGLVSRNGGFYNSHSKVGEYSTDGELDPAGSGEFDWCHSSKSLSQPSNVRR